MQYQRYLISFCVYIQAWAEQNFRTEKTHKPENADMFLNWQ